MYGRFDPRGWAAALAPLAPSGRLSGLGVGVGSMGPIAIGLTLFLFDIPAEGIFLISGVLFAVFAAPIFLIVREKPTSDQRFRLAAVPAALGQLPETIRDARAVAGLPRFLLRRFFYS